LRVNGGIHKGAQSVFVLLGIPDRGPREASDLKLRSRMDVGPGMGRPAKGKEKRFHGPRGVWGRLPTAAELGHAGFLDSGMSKNFFKGSDIGGKQ